MAKEKRLADAAAHADWIVQSCGITRAPVMPLTIAETEAPLLTVCCGDYRDRFDGRLEYHCRKNRFLLFYNTKYNAGMPPGRNAPRTRFSIAHELGHYFLEHHHNWLRGGGEAHPSRSEFFSDVMMEQEADAFAASLLMPTHLFRPVVNTGELSLDQISNLASEFRTSFVSTAIRAVQLSDFCTAVAGLREGRVAWTFVSQALVEAGFYPPARGQDVRSVTGQEAWAAFQSGSNNRHAGSGYAREWFCVFDDDLGRKSVMEGFHPVRAMGTLIVLLTIPEDELVFDEY